LDTDGSALLEAGRLTLVTPASVQPVTMAMVKQQLRVTHSSEDDLISHLIDVATSHIFARTRYAMLAQTWEMRLDRFPSRRMMNFPFAPLSSVTSLKYDDVDNVEQTMDSSLYAVETGIWPGRLRLNTGQTWPTIYGNVDNVRAVFVCGNTSASLVPADLKQAVLMGVGHWYANREDVVTGTIASSLARSIDSLIAPYVVPRML